MKQIVHAQASRCVDQTTQEPNTTRSVGKPMASLSRQPPGDDARRILEVRECERRRIARELHDEFGQRLTGLKFDLTWLRKCLAIQPRSVTTDSLVNKTESMMDSVDALIASIRNTATSLHPAILDNLGLLPALEWLVSDFRARTNIQCKADIDPALSNSKMTIESATALYRIVQELLTNVARHAEASTVTIALSERSEGLVLHLVDDGKGFSHHQAKRKSSLGLRGIRERISMLEGTMAIVGKSGFGTAVSITLPHAAIVKDRAGIMH
ncbi:sensor histidine kinase [Petrachloros mirabilis]